MPIEIRELVIRATVPGGQPEAAQLEAMLVRLKAQLLAECLRRVDERYGHAEQR